jgi:hypothetical protein
MSIDEIENGLVAGWHPADNEPPEVELGAPEDESAELAVLRGQLIVGAAITTIQPPAPLVAGVLDLDSVTVIYGRPGCGKSFVALDLAASIATGTPWQGRPTAQGPVLYVAAEGVSGLGQRVRAWSDYHSEVGDNVDLEQLVWLPRPVNVLEPRWLAGLCALVAELRPVLVIIDTVARSMIGGDENAARDMSKVVEAADMIRRAAGGCVLLIHHSGKDESRGMRGSIALEAGCDAAWEITSDTAWLTATCHRQKNHPTDGQPIVLAMAKIGESVVLVPDTRRPVDTLHDSIRTTLLALDQVETGTGTSTSVWLRTSGIEERTFYRHRKKLLALNLIVNVGSDSQPRYQLTEAGHDCLTTDRGDK